MASSRFIVMFLDLYTVLAAASPRVSSIFRRAAPQTVVDRTTSNKEIHTYQQLAGHGFVPSNARDKYGDTLEGYGSAIALDRRAWKKTKNGSYTGLLWAIPDRGWNTEGTLNYQNRIHKFDITLGPQPNATLAKPSGPNLQITYADIILFTGPDDTPTTGLDADITGYINPPGFPILLVATYTGDGYGGAGTGGRRIPIDSEGLVLAPHGGFYVSNEYGPYIYHFSAEERMTQATMPPEVHTETKRQLIIPANTVTGRDNNQGFEGLTASADGQTLYALKQSALDQEDGPNKLNCLQARLLEYDISDPSAEYKAEYIVTLPLYTDPTADKASKATEVAAQSDIHSLSNGQSLILARDSSAGHGQSSSTSVYRHTVIFDVSASSGATDTEGATYDGANRSIASATGMLDAGIKAAECCTFLDYNVNSQLWSFRLHNGGAQDQCLLTEKWESLAMVPVDGEERANGEWSLFSASDNDFITQDVLNFGKYPSKDNSEFSLDNQALVFQVQLPKNANHS